jgi:ABC-type glycerol-3-phosphate transport system substrate-binding protein
MRSSTLKLLLIISFVSMVLLASCQPASTPVEETSAATAVETEAPPAEVTTAPPEGEPDGEVVDLRIWQIPLSDAYIEWWEGFIAEYNESHPNVNVTLETFPFDIYVERRVGALATGTIGDLFWGVPDPFHKEAFAAGQITPLDDLIDVDRIVGFQRDTCVFDGQLACMPLYFAPALFFYNKAHFEEAGIDPQTWENPGRPTWDEFIAANQALLDAGIPPLVIGNADEYPGVFYLHAIQQRLGGTQPLFDAAWGDGSYTAENFMRAAELSQGLVEDGFVLEGFNAIGSDRKYTIFTDGEGAMTYMGFWISPYLVDAEAAGFDYGFFDFPSFPDDGNPDSQGDVMGGVESMYLRAGYEHPEVAAEFLNAFLSPEAQASYLEAVQVIPPGVGTLPETVDENSTIAVRVAEFMGQQAEGSYSFVDYDIPTADYNAWLAGVQELFIGDIGPQEYWESVDEAHDSAQ